MPKPRQNAPPWVHLIAADMETYGFPNKDTLIRIWRETDPESVSNIEITSCSKGKINSHAIDYIDWTKEIQSRFLESYFFNVGQKKLNNNLWTNKSSEISFVSMCKKLCAEHGFQIDKESGFHPAEGAFSTATKEIADKTAIKKSVDKLIKAVVENDGSIAVTQVFGLLQSIMKVKHPEDKYFESNAAINDKIKKSVSSLEIVDKNLVKSEHIDAIAAGYAAFVGNMAVLRNKYTHAHGTYSFNEEVFHRNFLKSLALFAIGFYFLHFG